MQNPSLDDRISSAVNTGPMGDDDDDNDANHPLADGGTIRYSKISCVQQPGLSRYNKINYIENTSELLRSELKQTQAIINLAHRKLQANLPILLKHFNVQRTHSGELEQSLLAFEELGDLLSRFAIDEAFEADEEQKKILQSPSGSNNRKCDGNSPKTQGTEVTRNSQMIRNLPAYELPEHDDGQISELLLKYRNQREIELKEIGRLPPQQQQQQQQTEEDNSESEEIEQAKSLHEGSIQDFSSLGDAAEDIVNLAP